VLAASLDPIDAAILHSIPEALAGRLDAGPFDPAAMAAGRPIDALLGEAGEPVVLEWVTRLGLPARIDRLEAELHRARSELQGQIEELRREVAQYHVELMDLSSSRPIVAPQRSDAPSSRSPAHG